jgi:uncharacterized protein YdeI (YjbR/CyaY-like superfamily)
MRPRAVKNFASRGELRAWLEKHHATVRELFVRTYKVQAAGRGVSYRDIVDECLCFGWIDGVRHAIDAESFSTRISPRKRESKWSAINRKRMRELIDQGVVAQPGMDTWKAAPKKAAGYSFESKPVALPPRFTRQLKADKKAFAYFEQQPPWYRRVSSFWVMSAKKEETRQRRMDSLIAYSHRNEPIGPLARKPAK